MCLPGGVGTLDETFELLTLTQTGKGMPVPIVLLDEPGDPYWEAVDGLMQQLVRHRLESTGDTALYTITDSCDEAWRIIDKFYANYDSIRFVGDHMVMRMQHGLTDAQLADLNERYGHFIVDGTIHRAEPYKIEVRDNDKLDLERIAFHFTRHGYDDIIRLIGDINSYVT
ncbi:LOG family protein [uncultured Ilumatobacter sp.]|uniref:LOG family protein n=1 Tax=uncultured Ilumatobacter sp. TaxID=879968 RepID=UPI00374EFC26